VANNKCPSNVLKIIKIQSKAWYIIKSPSDIWTMEPIRDEIDGATHDWRLASLVAGATKEITNRERQRGKWLGF
jgi:hypothetical protein